MVLSSGALGRPSLSKLDAVPEFWPPCPPMPAMHLQGIRVYRPRYCLASDVLSNALVQDMPLTNLQPARPGAGLWTLRGGASRMERG